MPSASACTSTAPSLNGGSATVSRLMELATPGLTVRARMRGIQCRAPHDSKFRTIEKFQRHQSNIGASDRRFDRHDLEGVHLAVLAADRDIFARPEGMTAEPEATLVVFAIVAIVIEEPAARFGRARVEYHLPDLILLAFPKPAHAAM